MKNYVIYLFIYYNILFSLDNSRHVTIFKKGQQIQNN